jgi:hypothetical protein
MTTGKEAFILLIAVSSVRLKYAIQPSFCFIFALFFCFRPDYSDSLLGPGFVD